MLALVGSLLAAALQPAQSAEPDACSEDPNCVHASAAQLFAAADGLAAQGDIERAQALLEALTQDPDSDTRSEARFRLAAVLEKRGDVAGAIVSLQALLAEKPDAQRPRLELARLLGLQGKTAAAQREFDRAEARGLPAEVLQTVRRFSSALAATRKRGASIEFVVAPDSNVNRATRSDIIDTVIAPFELDADAQEQAGIGTSAGVEAWSRDRIAGTTFLTRASAHADLFPGKSQFNDIQAVLSTGPEFQTVFGRVQPSASYERRWFGGRGYASGYGPALSWLAPAGTRSQVQIDGSAIHQTIDRNKAQDGWRYGLSAAFDHAFSEASTARVTLRGVALDARIRPESLYLAGGDLLLARVFRAATVFVQIGYTQTDGRAPILLFDKTRHDDRLDLGAGVIARGLGIGPFQPLVRLVYTDSRSNIALYDYRRARLELGFTRTF